MHQIAQDLCSSTRHIRRYILGYVPVDVREQSIGPYSK
jgi:hypothetical protein